MTTIEIGKCEQLNLLNTDNPNFNTALVITIKQQWKVTKFIVKVTNVTWTSQE